MIDMTLNEEDKKDFIVDIRVDEDGIKVVYANGFTETCRVASKHNLEFYRSKMEEQALKHIDKFITHYSIKGLLFLKTEMVPLILLLIEIFFVFNIDVKLFTRILLFILSLISSLALKLFYEYKIFKYMILTEEAETVKYFLDNKNKFLTEDEEGEKYYSLNIEEISQMDLTQKDLMNSINLSEELKNENEDTVCMKVLTSKKNML